MIARKFSPRWPAWTTSRFSRKCARRGFLEQVQPAIYVKGGDYKPETLDAEERGVLEKIGRGDQDHSIRSRLFDVSPD